MAVRGGYKFAKAIKKFANNLGSASVVRIGFFQDAKYPDGTQVAAVAAFNDYGTSRIPSRPFFRNMVRSKKKGWPGAVAQLMKTYNYNSKKVLTAMGQGIKEQLQDSIINTNTPPNAPSTLAHKKGSKPLVDTGLMLRKVDFKVE